MRYFYVIFIFLTFITKAMAGQAFVENKYTGAMVNPWGFQIQIPKGFVGRDVSPKGIQNHGVSIAFGQGDKAGELSIYAGYNATLQSSPACLAHELWTVTTSKRKLICARKVAVIGIEGWSVQYREGHKICETWYVLREPAREFTKQTLERDFKDGCEEAEIAPRFEYEMTMLGSESSFSDVKALWGSVLRTWKWLEVNEK